MTAVPLPFKIDGKPIKLPRARAPKGRERPAWSDYKPKTPVDCDHCVQVAYETAMAGEPHVGLRKARRAVDNDTSRETRSDTEIRAEWQELAVRAERQYLTDHVFHAMVELVAQRRAGERLSAALAAKEAAEAERDELRRVKGTDYEVVAYDGEAHVAKHYEATSWDSPPEAELMGSVGDLIRRLDEAEADAGRLRAKIDGPCGSCHPCTNYADETWRASGRKPPHVYQWDEMLARAERAEAQVRAVEALLAEWEAKAGPESDAWEVFGPQTIGVPFVLERVRAALGGPA